MLRLLLADSQQSALLTSAVRASVHFSTVSYVRVIFSVPLTTTLPRKRVADATNGTTRRWMASVSRAQSGFVHSASAESSASATVFSDITLLPEGTTQRQASSPEYITCYSA